jgi:hypothetical protein
LILFCCFAEVQVAGQVQEVEEGVKVAPKRQGSNLEKETAENDEDQKRETHEPVQALD